MKQIRYNILLLTMIVLLCDLPAHAEPVDLSSAIALARQYTRFDTLLGKATGYSGTGSCVAEPVSSDCIPYSEESADDTAWKVTFGGVKLWSEGPCGQEAEFEFYIDKSDSTFLFALRKPYNDRDSLLPGPTEIAADIPKVIRCILYEFIGFVAHPPEIPLTGALAKATFSRPCGARSVIAYLLKLRNREKEEFVAWVVVGVEAPAIGLSGPDGPSIETWVTIVNAETGKAVTAAQLSAEESKE